MYNSNNNNNKRYSYTLRDILDLQDAIKAKENSDKLSRQQRTVLRRAFSTYVRKLDLDEDIERFMHKRLDTYSDVFNYIYNNLFDKKDISDETRVDIQLFNVLAKNKGKTITLKELYEAVYNGVYSSDDIKEKFKIEEERIAFISKLNGCISETLVADIDIKDLDPQDFSSIKINIGDQNNPLLFVSSLNVNNSIEIDMEDGEFTFLTISDLHLDSWCYEIDLETGNAVLNRERLEENLLAFAKFKEMIIEALGEEVKIGGVVYTGDVFEAFTTKGRDPNKPISFKRENRADLMHAFVEFEDTHGSILKTSFGSEEPYFTAYISGNHDMTLGRKVFSDLMKFLGDDAVNLGDGVGRIKLGKDFISFIHDDSLDWGIPNWDLKFTNRKAKNRSSFHFDDYFEICKKYYDEIVTDKDDVKIVDLVEEISSIMKDENEALYKYFLPYTIKNCDVNPKNVKPQTTDPETRKKIHSTIPFFANFMYIDPVTLELKKKVGGDFYPEAMMYEKFINGGTKVQEALSQEGLIVPQYGRGDDYQSVLTVLAHFHKSLSGAGNGTFKPALSGKTGKRKELPVMVFEGASYLDGDERNLGYDFSATQYKIKIKNGKIDRIGVIPLATKLYKDRVDGVIDFVGELDIKPETYYSSRKR